MVKFRASFLDFIKDPIASALWLTLFSHAKVMFQAYSLLNIVYLELESFVLLIFIPAQPLYSNKNIFWKLF